MKTKHQLAYMECAEAFAKCSVGQRAKVGCVIVKPNGGQIAEGYNGLPSHLSGPLEDEFGNTKPDVRHAEENALLKLSGSTESAKGCYMFITLSPCKHCAGDILDAGIAKVFFKDSYKDMSGVRDLIDNGVEVFHLVEGSFFCRLGKVWR